MLMFRPILIFVALLLPFASNAAPTFDETLSQSLASGPKCYGREYSQEHLKAHPKQRVRLMRLKFFKDQGDENIYLSLSVEAKANIKDSETGEMMETYRSYGNTMTCVKAEATGLNCYIDCDGGSATVNLNVKNTTADSILFRNDGLQVQGDCGSDPEDSFFLEALKGGDDVFKLYALRSEYCQN